MSQLLPNEGVHNSTFPYPHQYNEVMASIPTSSMISYNRHLLGRLLTFIDATVADKEQKKAQKDIVRQIVWDTNAILTEWMYDNRTQEKNNKDIWVEPETRTASLFPF